MPKLDPKQLPYPGPAVAVTRRGGHKHAAPVPDAIVAGSAQCPDIVAIKGTTVKDAEGVLAFYEKGFMFHSDSGKTSRSVVYEALAGYSLERRRLMAKMGLRTLTLHGTDGATVHFRLGAELAANAEYILTSKGVATK
jgi:hypothetical protein